MGLKFSHNNYEELEEHRNDPDKIREIMLRYDTDGSGFLEGLENSTFIDGVVHYLIQTRLKGKGFQLTYSDICHFIHRCLNKNSDGRLEVDELIDGVNLVFSGIDLYIARAIEKNQIHTKN